MLTDPALAHLPFVAYAEPAAVCSVAYAAPVAFAAPPRKCRACGGLGVRWKYAAVEAGRADPVDVPCTYCRGTGVSP